ncbi:MAG TPA: tetratricopeptide repeat protein [Flavipsychrobacter sp.]|nr:tetratricopeptide repeat protein [Flavipsychrobacter sp.]
MKKVRLIIVVLVCSTSMAYAQNKQVRTGNKLYQEKKYKEAAAAYQQALKKNPAFTPGMFNLGNALYQQKNFDASRQVMTNTAKQAKDKTIKADANYNIGNTYMNEQKWQEAANAYKAALRNNPQDEAAKYNLSYALAMMKKEQSGDGKNNKQENKDQQDKNDQNKNDQNKEHQEQKNKDESQNEENSKEQQQSEGKEEQKDQKDQRSQSQPSKLSKEQAEQLLNALAQEEKRLHDKKEKGKAVKVKVEKDW